MNRTIDIQTADGKQVTKRLKIKKVKTNYSLRKQVQQYHKVTILCLHRWKLAQIKIAQIKNRRIKKLQSSLGQQVLQLGQKGSAKQYQLKNNGRGSN